MAGDLQPLQQYQQIVKEDGTPTEFFIRWAQERQIDITSAITSVSGTSPIASSGGATPVISILPASNALHGSMSAADFTKLAGIAALAGVSQLASTISDFSEAVDDRVATLLVAGTNITLTYNDGAGTLTIASSQLSKFPLVDGSVPPNLVYQEDGSLIYVEI